MNLNKLGSSKTLSDYTSAFRLNYVLTVSFILVLLYQTNKCIVNNHMTLCETLVRIKKSIELEIHLLSGNMQICTVFHEIDIFISSK